MGKKNGYRKSLEDHAKTMAEIGCQDFRAAKFFSCGHFSSLGRRDRVLCYCCELRRVKDGKPIDTRRFDSDRKRRLTPDREGRDGRTFRERKRPFDIAKELTAKECEVAKLRQENRRLKKELAEVSQ